MMKLFMYIDRVNRLHQLIKRKRTGTPEELAERLNLSVSRIYQIIEELKLMEVPIAYSRTFRSYYYTSAYEILIDVQLRPLNNQEYHNTNGGCYAKITVLPNLVPSPL
ncbi:HTH domain-containing protein [Olivibacter sp. SDN3]|uniref:HTH domain-containing protein n=1 Tax=Olivibacter sp. SDN3 TaxID=2764720 RepID=UPI0016517971|nr:HTH domain-containing protein [Olivibacter sp. SDN3]QNL52060.1 HTH domain-containing protein [Olivibacter sp. SDN3]